MRLFGIAKGETRGDPATQRSLDRGAGRSPARLLVAPAGATNNPNDTVILGDDSPENNIQGAGLALPVVEPPSADEIPIRREARRRRAKFTRLRRVPTSREMGAARLRRAQPNCCDHFPSPPGMPSVALAKEGQGQGEEDRQVPPTACFRCPVRVCHSGSACVRRSLAARGLSRRACDVPPEAPTSRL